MDGETSKSRNQDTATLLDYGFNTYKSITLYKKGEEISKIDFNNSKTKQDSIIAKEDINIIVKKNINVNELKIEILVIDIDAPKDQNQIIAKINIKDTKGSLLATYNLYPKNNIEKLTFLDLLFTYFKQLI